MAHKVIQNVRFPLLDMEKLSQVEVENSMKAYIPVSTCCTSKGSSSPAKVIYENKIVL